jgi:hypothetical protein
MVESELRPSQREEDEVIRDHTSESDTALSPNAVFALETSILISCAEGFVLRATGKRQCAAIVRLKRD